MEPFFLHASKFFLEKAPCYQQKNLLNVAVCVCFSMHLSFPVHEKPLMGSGTGFCLCGRKTEMRGLSFCLLCVSLSSSPVSKKAGTGKGKRRQETGILSQKGRACACHHHVSDRNKDGTGLEKRKRTLRASGTKN